MKTEELHHETAAARTARTGKRAVDPADPLKLYPIRLNRGIERGGTSLLPGMIAGFTAAEAQVVLRERVGVPYCPEDLDTDEASQARAAWDEYPFPIGESRVAVLDRERGLPAGFAEHAKKASIADLHKLAHELPLMLDVVRAELADRGLDGRTSENVGLGVPTQPPIVLSPPTEKNVTATELDHSMRVPVTAAEVRANDGVATDGATTIESPPTVGPSTTTNEAPSHARPTPPNSPSRATTTKNEGGKKK